MNIECQEYDLPTGRILRSHSVPEESYKYMRDEVKLPVVRGRGRGSTHYVSGGQILERPVMEIEQDKQEIVSNGEDTVTFSGLPIPCTVRIGEEEYEVPDGVFEWGTFLEGTYAVKVIGFPYMDYKSEVIAFEGDTQAKQGGGIGTQEG